MTCLRWTLATFLVLFVAVPLFFPLAESWQHFEGDAFQGEGTYLSVLARNTILLAVGTVALALPLGTLAALLLFRTDLPCRWFWLAAVMLVLFVPLPLLMSGWQALLGSDGWLPLAWWGANANRPWTTGLLPAIWVHALAGIPWIVLMVGSGLCWVENELEEDTLLIVGPWRTFLHVTLPRCRVQLLAAGLWLALYTVAEISVTYFLQVPTFAEEVHTQFSSGNPQALARSVILSCPSILFLWFLLLAVIPGLEKTLPPLDIWLAGPALFRFGKVRWPLALAFSLLSLVVCALPLIALGWKLGLSGSPATWSAGAALTTLVNEIRISSGQVLATLLCAGVTAAATAALALVACWLALKCRWLQVFLLVLFTLTWAYPGAIVGIGLKQWILWLIDHGLPRPFTVLLYYGPSPLPVMWVQLLRFLPFAAAMLWPVVRLLPGEILATAQLEGASPTQVFWHVIVPLVRVRFAWTTLILGALCLGEVAASSHVDTPGWDFFQKLIFVRMHYGVDTSVSALCLLLLAWLVGLLILAYVLRKFSEKFGGWPRFRRRDGI